jgi:hypothetical protein
MALSAVRGPGGLTTATLQCSSIRACVRARDMTDVMRQQRSTVSRYVRILGDPKCFPNQMQDYLLGPITAPHKALLLCRADIFFIFF